MEHNGMILRSLYTVTVALVVFLGGTTPAAAETFPMPVAGDDLIGSLKHARARQEDTLIDIARRFSVGQDEMVMANQNVDRWLPKAGTEVLIPQEFILPDAPRAGIIVNIPEMRLYYFPVKPRPVPVKKSPVTSAKKASAAVNCTPMQGAQRNVKVPSEKVVASVSGKTKTQGAKPQTPAPTKQGAASKDTKSAKPAKPAAVQGKKVSQARPCVPVTQAKKPEAPKPVVAETPEFDASVTGEVISFPVSMGRMDWRTPLGMTRVVNKQKDPSWTPPASIKREHAAKGDPLPDVVPPGPDNPLGKYAMRLGVSGYLIHGTDAAKADGIGMRVTHGCMRMYNEDVAKLFPLVPVGAPVYLVNQPVKLGWKNGWLYMEVSQPLDEDAGIQGHDPDENVTKAQLEWEDEQRASFLLKLANTAISKLKDRSELSINMDKVRKAVFKPTGVPLVIGGKSSDTSWEAAAASEEGLTPKNKVKTTSDSDLSQEPAAAPASSGTRIRPSRNQELLKGFDEAPISEPELPESYDSAPLEDAYPAKPASTPASRAVEKMPYPGDRPRVAPKVSDSGVKIQTYGGDEGNEFEEE